MGVPTCRHNHRRRGNRRAHNALSGIMTTTCRQCQQPVLPHRVCKVCGTYSGRSVLLVDKRIKKALAKTSAASDHDHTEKKEA